MSAASTSDARKRNAPVVDPVEIVARVLSPGACVKGCAACEARAQKVTAIVAALRAEGLLA